MQHKIWYKNTEPTVIISTGKDVGGPDESMFLSDLRPEDDEFYTIDQGPPQVVVRKPQPDIDAILAARIQAAADYDQKQTDAKAQLRLNDLANKTYARVDTYIENQVTNLASVKTVLKRFGKIILAMLKHGDFSN